MMTRDTFRDRIGHCLSALAGDMSIGEPHDGRATFVNSSTGRGQDPWAAESR